VLPIGGVKEKLLAAHRAGSHTVILPRDNEKDLADIPAAIQQELSLRFVESMDEVLEVALKGRSRFRQFWFLRPKPRLCWNLRSSTGIAGR